MSRLECASSRLKSSAGAGHVISDKRCDQRSSLEEAFSRSTGFSTAAVFSQVLESSCRLALVSVAPVGFDPTPLRSSGAF
ncbi:uncharacterized [Tachysurus ichikawai]